jgi:acetylglutamate kinase
MTYRQWATLLWCAALPLAAQAQPASPQAPPAFTVETPLQQIAADPAAAAVLNQDVPGLLTDKAYNDIKGMSLKELAPLSGGDITREMLEKTQADLKALGQAKTP